MFSEFLPMTVDITQCNDVLLTGLLSSCLGLGLKAAQLGLGLGIETSSLGLGLGT